MCRTRLGCPSGRPFGPELAAMLGGWPLAVAVALDRDARAALEMGLIPVSRLLLPHAERCQSQMMRRLPDSYHRHTESGCRRVLTVNAPRPSSALREVAVPSLTKPDKEEVAGDSVNQVEPAGMYRVRSGQ